MTLHKLHKFPRIHPDIRILLQQRQRALVALVRLTEHGLSRLCDNIVVGILYHLRSNIRIPDGRFRRRGILYDVIQVADRML